MLCLYIWLCLFTASACKFFILFMHHFFMITCFEPHGRWESNGTRMTFSLSKICETIQLLTDCLTWQWLAQMLSHFWWASYRPLEDDNWVARDIVFHQVITYLIHSMARTYLLGCTLYKCINASLTYNILNSNLIGDMMVVTREISTIELEKEYEL
jgi:hypothetical protein